MIWYCDDGNGNSLSLTNLWPLSWKRNWATRQKPKNFRQMKPRNGKLKKLVMLPLGATGVGPRQEKKSKQSSHGYVHGLRIRRGYSKCPCSVLSGCCRWWWCMHACLCVCLRICLYFLWLYFFKGILLGMTEYACNFYTQKADVGELQVWAQPRLQVPVSKINEQNE